MIAHVVLFRPKAGLADADRVRVIDALRDGHARITQIRRFRVGTRMLAGKAYDALSRDFPYFVMLEFDTRDDLEAYLTHPAHDALSLSFHQAGEAAEAYDYEIADAPEAIDALMN
jgi:hypothetical protein